MPWNSGQGKFIRANPDFSGETVWQQDQQATIKIIAARHDSHDQDLANGISQCINVDGITSMNANLDLNSNKIVNLAPGTNPTDAVNWNQLDTQNTDLTDYIDAGDQGSKDYADQIVADIDITAVTWLPASNTIRLTKGDASTVADAIDDFDQPVTFGQTTHSDLRMVDLRSSGLIKHKSAAFSTGVVALQTLSSSRWTFANNGNSTLNFQRPTGADPYLGESYEVEGTVLVTNGASPGTITIQADGGAVAPDDILGSAPTLSGQKGLLSYVIHRASGNNYTMLFIWSAVS